MRCGCYTTQPDRYEAARNAGQGAQGVRLAMRRWILMMFVAGIAAVLLASAVSAYPRPSRVSSRPEVNFQPGPLRMYTDDDGSHYWYLVYDVVNMSGEDRTWAPSVVLFTDRGEVLRDGAGVSRRVNQAILEHVGDPLLEPKVAIIGVLRQGGGHARRGMIVWPADRTDVNELRVFVQGMSPETAIVPNPVTGDPVTLRKNLYLHYLVSGDPISRGDTAIGLHPDYTAEEHWVFR